MGDDAVVSAGGQAMTRDPARDPRIGDRIQLDGERPVRVSAVSAEDLILIPAEHLALMQSVADRICAEWPELDRCRFLFLTLLKIGHSIARGHFPAEGMVAKLEAERD
jgi:hypothetical protein